MQLVIALSLLLGAAPAGQGKVTEAERLFDQARDLMKAFRASEACPLFEGSHKLDPALGTLLNLADCYEKTGQTAKAYLSFNEAAGWAKRTREATREETATARASALKGKLSWLTLTSAVSTPGLVVSVGTFRIDLGATPVSLPVDAGELSVLASAPGRHDWSTRVRVGPSGTASVQVPSLLLKEPAVADAPTPSPVVTVTPPPSDDSATGQPSQGLGLERRASQSAKYATPAIACWVAGGAAIVAGSAGLGWSLSTYGRFERQQPGHPDEASPTVTRQQFDTLRWMYPASWAVLGLGVASVGAGTLLYLQGEPVTTRVAAGPGGATVSFAGSF